MTPETRPPADDQPLSPYEGGPLGSGIDWADPNSPLAPYYLRSGWVVAVAVIGLLFFLFSIFPLWHTDFWAHLKYGEWVVANRELPKTEPLNPFTDKSKSMFDAMWLTQVVYYELFRAGESLAGGDDALRRFAGGVELIRLVHNFAVTAALAVLLLAYKRVSGSIAWAVGGVVLVVVFLLTPLQVQRPQTFAILCFALILFGLSREVPSRRFVVWAPALLVLWANLHGSFPIGFALIGLMLVGRVIEVGRDAGWSVRAVIRDTVVRRFVLAIVLGLAAVAVLNPYGIDLFRNVARFSDSPNLLTMAEWQPILIVGSGAGLAYLLLAFLLVVTQAVSPRPFTPTQLLLVIVFGVWALFQQRMFSWWLPLVPWIIAPHWAAAAEKWGLAFRPGTPNFVKTMAAAALAFIAVGLSPAVTWPRTGGPRPVEQALHMGTPFDIAAALTGAKPADPARAGELPAVVRDWYGGKFTGRVFSSEAAGEYLLWALPPDAPVLMYNHAQLFPPLHWSECLAVKAGRPGWWEILDRHQVNLVVVETDGHAALRDEIKDHPGWRVVVDETDVPNRPPLGRLFVAVRKPIAFPGGQP